MKIISDHIKRNPSIVFYVIAGFVALSFLLTILIDIFNVFGAKELLIRNLDIPFFWVHYFEIPFLIPIGWFLLAVVLLIFAINAGVAIERQDKPAFSFWFLISIGIALMLVEDTGDVRHLLRFKIEDLAGEGPYGFIGTLWELFYFGVLGSVMLIAVLYYRKVYWGDYKTRKYLITGYLFYFVSQVSSFTSTAFQSEGAVLWYEKAGSFIMSSFFVWNETTELAYEMAMRENEWFNFDFMDVVYEESLEFLGAGALLTAGVYFLVNYQKKHRN